MALSKELTIKLLKRSLARLPSDESRKKVMERALKEVKRIKAKEALSSPAKPKAK